MSNESYLKKHYDGYFKQIGSYNVCELAAMDRISPDHEVSHRSYEDFVELYDWYMEKHGTNANYRDMEVVSRKREVVGGALGEIGVYSSRNFRGFRVTDPFALQDVLDSSFSGGFRVTATVDVDAPHSIGVVEADEPGYYWTVSNWSPVASVDRAHAGEGPANAEELFEHLEQSPRYRKRQYSSRKTVKLNNLYVLG